VADTIAADDEIKSVVLFGKPANFIAGADIGMIQHVKTEDDAYRMSRELQRVLQKIEALPKPVIAAINGPCLGNVTQNRIGIARGKAGITAGSRRHPALTPADSAGQGHGRYTDW
jgi:1,4-dihydroxy-2-naphthoyl-CoA synthase